MTARATGEVGNADVDERGGPSRNATASAAPASAAATGSNTPACDRAAGARDRGRSRRRADRARRWAPRDPWRASRRRRSRDRRRARGSRVDRHRDQPAGPSPMAARPARRMRPRRRKYRSHLWVTRTREGTSPPQRVSATTSAREFRTRGVTRGKASHCDGSGQMCQEVIFELPRSGARFEAVVSGAMAGAAFFDLDKTIIAKSSVLAFGKPFYREGLLSKRTIVKSMYAQIVYMLVGADESKMEEVREAMLSLTKGWDQTHVASIVAETLDEMISPIVFAEALELFEEHHRAGRTVVIVSSSPEEVVKPIGAFLEVDRRHRHAGADRRRRRVHRRARVLRVRSAQGGSDREVRRRARHRPRRVLRVLGLHHRRTNARGRSAIPSR